MRTNKHMVIISKSQFRNCWYPRVHNIGSEVVWFRWKTKTM